MDINNTILEFQTWLKTLGDGEATFYGLLLTGFITVIIWLFKKFFDSNSKKESSIQNIASNGSMNIGNSKNSHNQIINQNIKIKKVKASHGGTATGVIIGKNSEQTKAQDEHDRK